jgi:hypothetical protein
MCGQRFFDLGDQPDLLESVTSGSGIRDHFAPHGLVFFLSGTVDSFHAALDGFY